MKRRGLNYVMMTIVQEEGGQCTGVLSLLVRCVLQWARL